MLSFSISALVAEVGGVRGRFLFSALRSAEFGCRLWDLSLEWLAVRLVSDDEEDELEDEVETDMLGGT